jgi:hypothetical protein
LAILSFGALLCTAGLHFGRKSLETISLTIKKEKMSKIINCTPHPINICNSEGDIYHVFPKGEIIPRLSTITETSANITLEDAVIPTTKTKFGEVENLPKAIWGTFLIVSQLVKSACPNRADLLVPAEVVRDKDGNIIGCQSLGR